MDVSTSVALVTGAIPLAVDNAGITADANLLTGDLDGPKSDPAAVAALAVDAVAAGDYEVLADDTSRRVRAGFADGVEALYPQLAI